MYYKRSNAKYQGHTIKTNNPQTPKKKKINNKKKIR